MLAAARQAPWLIPKIQSKALQPKFQVERLWPSHPVNLKPASPYIVYAQKFYPLPRDAADGIQRSLLVLQDASVGAALHEDYQSRCERLFLRNVKVVEAVGCKRFMVDLL